MLHCCDMFKTVEDFFFFFFRGYSINTCNGFSFKKGKKNEAL